jgi:hypothetical protein
VFACCPVTTPDAKHRWARPLNARESAIVFGGRLVTTPVARHRLASPLLARGGMIVLQPTGSIIPSMCGLDSLRHEACLRTMRSGLARRCAAQWYHDIGGHHSCTVLGWRSQSSQDTCLFLEAFRKCMKALQVFRAPSRRCLAAAGRRGTMASSTCLTGWATAPAPPLAWAIDFSPPPAVTSSNRSRKSMAQGSTLGYLPLSAARTACMWNHKRVVNLSAHPCWDSDTLRSMRTCKYTRTR